MQGLSELENGSNLVSDTVTAAMAGDISLQQISSNVSQGRVCYPDPNVDLEILEYHTATSSWESLSRSNLGEDPLQLPNCVKARIFLLQAPLDLWSCCQAISTIPNIGFDEIRSKFGSNHISNALPYSRMKYNEKAFSAKSYRCVTQFSKQWKIDQKIAQNRPYSGNTAIPPDKLNAAHESYRRVHASRSCIPLYSSPKLKPSLGQDYRLALEDCVSYYIQQDTINGGLIGKKPSNAFASI